jgi:hypothetical protein
MTCNYQNINDICLNKYTYQYQNVIFNGNTCVADSGPLSSVIRTDIDTGIIDIINSLSLDTVEDCDKSSETEVISAWECYQLYVQSGKSISDAPIEAYRLAQSRYIVSSYNDSLIMGIDININGNTFTLSASLSDQVYYRNIVSMAQLAYSDDVDSTMPSFTDISNILHKLSYDDLSAVFQSYFFTAIYLKTLKDFLLNKIQQSDKIIDIQSIIWDTSIQIEGEPTDSIPLQVINNTAPVCASSVVTVQSQASTSCCVCLGNTMSWDCGSSSLCDGIFYPDDNDDNVCGCAEFILYQSGSCESMTSEQYADFSGQCIPAGGTVTTLTQGCRS